MGERRLILIGMASLARALDASGAPRQPSSANPLDDIQNTDDIERVMQNGRLYEAATMNEVVTGNAEKAAYWWE